MPTTCAVEFVIDGRPVSGSPGESVLSVAKRAGIKIPTLCHHDALPDDGRCRLCVVDVKKGGRTRLVTACLYPVEAGIEVMTSSPDVDRVRKAVIELLWSRCPNSQEIGALAGEYGVIRRRYILGDPDEKCILCGLCMRTCAKLHDVSALCFGGRGIEKKATTPFDDVSPGCVGCASCASVCPTGAIAVKDSRTTRQIWGRTFKFHPCSGCGAPVLTVEHRASLIARGAIPEDYYTLCQTCRQAKAVNTFSQVTW